MRPAVADGFDHLDLTWNLVLAWVPFVVALVVYDRAKRGAGGAGLLALLGVWLVFFPNAPYIVTDLVYLQIWTREPLWYDEMTYVVFAVTGMMLGLASLYLVHRVARARLGASAGWLAVAAAALLAGLGVYLGRYLRWNSWDVLTNPRSLARNLVQILEDPVGKPIAVTVLFGAFVAVTYLALYTVAEMRPQGIPARIDKR